MSGRYIHNAVQGCVLVSPSPTSQCVNYKYKCDYCGSIGSSQFGCYPLSYGGTYKSAFTCHSCHKTNTIMITTQEV